MRLLIHYLHPADVNFFKNVIRILRKNNDIILMARSRGNLLTLLQHEIKGLPIYVFGKHYSQTHKKILSEPVRNLKQLLFLDKKRIDICIAFGAVGIGVACRLKGIPYIAFDDDESIYNVDMYIGKMTATRFVLPSSIPVRGRNVYTFNGFKELAYLHPKYFTPDKTALERYQLEENKYFFVREVARISWNYRHLENRLPTLIKNFKKFGYNILLSIEDKSLREMFKDDCIVLHEPIDHIYSLLKYASLTISSGDTMARESCLLGTPAIYTGGRDMNINTELIERKCMFIASSTQEILQNVEYIIGNNIKQAVEERINRSIEYDWDDTTEVILRHLYALRE